MPKTTTSVVDFDFSQFETEEYTSDREQFPSVIISTDIDEHGIFITDENREFAEWGNEDYPGMVSLVYKTKKGEKLPGKLIKNPRIVVVRVGKKLRSRKEGEKIRVVGEWVKGDKEHGFRLIQKYLVFFVDEDNEKLHNKPIQMSTKGTFQWSFDTNLQKFRKQFNEVYKKCAKTTKDRGEKFFSGVVFAFNTGAEIKGTGSDTNLACVVKSYVVPSVDNLTSMIITPQKHPEFFTILGETYDVSPDFGKFIPGGTDSDSETVSVENVEELITSFSERIESLSDIASAEALKAELRKSPLEKSVKDGLVAMLEAASEDLEIAF